MTAFEPDYALVAYVRDGRFAAVRATLAVLHARGLVDAGRSGSVRRTDVVSPPPYDFELRVWSAIHGFVAPGALMGCAPADAAFNELRREACQNGLVRRLMPVRAFSPARTRRGKQLVRSAAHRCPWPLSGEPADQAVVEHIGMAVALYGNAALEVLMPAFARDSGLLGRESHDEMALADPDAPGPQGRYY